MKEYDINGVRYELTKEYRDGFELDVVKERLTEYFADYDYVVGDWAYGKLRLKGFYEHDNKKVKELNDFNGIDEYLKDNCANNCRYFVIKRVKNKN